MTFAEFAAAVDERVKAYGVRRMVDQEDRDTHAGWVTSALHAQLFLHAENFHYPVYLGFTNISVEGVAITATAQTNYLQLKLDDYGARTAALEILRQFGVDFDPDDVP